MDKKKQPNIDPTPLLELKLKGGESVGISFKLPENLEQYGLSKELQEIGFQNYLLARYSNFHDMPQAFAINSFWHFILLQSEHIFLFQYGAVFMNNHVIQYLFLVVAYFTTRTGIFDLCNT